jgi:hypothetical protein
VLRDVVHILYQGVLCFQNTIRFHCTGVSIASVTPIRKVFLLRFSQTHTCSTAVCAALFNRISPKWANKCRKYGLKSFTLLRKVWVSPRRFSQNSRSFNKFLKTLPVLIFSQIRQKMYETGVKSDCHWADAHGTHSCMIRFCEELPHRIAWEFDTVWSPILVRERQTGREEGRRKWFPHSRYFFTS